VTTRIGVAGLCALAILAARAARDPAANPWFRAGREAVKRAAAAAPPARAKNAILFVGDGMGIATVTAARILAGQRAGGSGEENLLSFESLPYTAFSKTYTVDFQVGESAGTITALMTGVKTRSGVLGVDESVVRGDFAAAAAAAVPTLLERAEDAGKWTGVVTTTTVTHATPGAATATPDATGSPTRSSRQARAAGFPRHRPPARRVPHGDGSGRLRRRSRVLPAAGAGGERLDGRDLTAEWQKRFKGAPYVATREALLALDPAKSRHVLGLFAPSHLEFESMRADKAPTQPSLAEMTEAALDILTRSPKGFVLMVEGGRIDHGHHAGNAYRALTETIEFADAVRWRSRTSPRTR
jgi:alkaline phosphatase